MIGFSNILLAVDGEFDQPSLVAEVAAVAEGKDATITLLCISIPAPKDAEFQVEFSNLHESAKTARLQDPEALAAEIKARGIQVVIKQESGKAYEEIIREASRHSYDLIMKPAQSEGRKLEFLFGSTDMQLFRMSPTPVWIFKPTTTNKLRRIMVAVDLLAYDEEKSALADKLLTWGKHLSSHVGARLHVAHVWDLHREYSLRSKSVSARAIDSLLLALQLRHQGWLDDALERNGLDRNKVMVHFHKGDAEGMIPAIADSQKIDLLVMGTVGRTGIPGFFIGNTADSILRHVNCSVLAVKPDGFQTPVVAKN